VRSAFGLSSRHKRWLKMRDGVPAADALGAIWPSENDLAVEVHRWERYASASRGLRPSSLAGTIVRSIRGDG